MGFKYFYYTRFSTQKGKEIPFIFRIKSKKDPAKSSDSVIVQGYYPEYGRWDILPFPEMHPMELNLMIPLGVTKEKP